MPGLKGWKGEHAYMAGRAWHELMHVDGKAEEKCVERALVSRVGAGGSSGRAGCGVSANRQRLDGQI